MDPRGERAAAGTARAGRARARAGARARSRSRGRRRPTRSSGAPKKPASSRYASSSASGSVPLQTSSTGVTLARDRAADGRPAQQVKRHADRQRLPPAPAPRIGRVDARPIGIFDSGAGGLTVLHECLVTLPHEDFVYLGDSARCPYGPRPHAEIRRFAHEIAAYLEQEGVKLIVAACNAATSAALPALQEALTRADRRRARARGPRRGAGDAEPAHRPARHRGDRGERPLRGDRARARRRREGRVGRLPEARASDRGGVVGEELDAAVREYAAPLKEAEVDTVILGCTHYPMIRRVFERAFGRGTTLVFSADETAREVAETLARKRVENDPERRRLDTVPHDRRARGVPDARRAFPPASDSACRAGHRPRARARPGVSRRALPAPLTPTGHPSPPPASERTAEKRACGARTVPRACRDEPGAAPARRAAPGRDRHRIRRAGDRLRAHLLRRHARPLHRERGGGRAALAGRLGPRLAHGRVRDAARVDRSAHAARGERRQAEGAHGRDPAAPRPLAARASTTWRRSASTRSGSTATSSRPTAAPGRPRSRAPGWP